MAERNIVREDLVAISFDVDDGGLKKITDMLKDLKKLVENTASDAGDAINDIADEFEDLTDNIDDVTDSLNDVTNSFEDVIDSIDDVTDSLDDITDGFGDVIDSFDDAERVSRALRTNVVNDLNRVTSSVTNTGNRVTRTAGRFRDFVNTRFDNLINGLRRFNRETEESTEKVKELSESSNNIGAGIKGMVLKAAGAFAIGSTIKNAITTGMNFEAGMSTVKAVSGATEAEMEKLTKKAKEMGTNTIFSASEAAEAMNYMGMAGWKAEQMLSGIDGIMNLAAASGEDLGITSDIVTDALTAFGKSADFASDFADVLAVASSSANTNVAMMGETFKYVAPVAGALKYEYKDVAVAIGLMANSGIKAGQAGTALRSVFSRLAKPTKEAKIAMDKLGLSITDATTGKMKDFNQMMRDMRKGFKSLDTDEKAVYAKMLGGEEAMSGLLAIVNATENDFNNLTKAINNSAGAAEAMANIKNDNLTGQIKLLMSGVEAIYDEFYNHIKEPLKKVVSWITKNVIPKIIEVINIIAEKAGPIIQKVIDFISLRFEWLKNNVFPALTESFNTIKNAVVPVIETIVQKAIGLFDKIFEIFMINKDTILNALNSVLRLFTYFTDNILPELVNAFNWVIQTITPAMSDVVNIISETVKAAVPFIEESISSIITIIKGISPIVKGIADIVLGVIKKISQNMNKVTPILKTVAKGYIFIKTAMLAYKSVALALNIVLKTQAAWLKIVDIAETAYIVTLYAAETAMKIFNATAKAGPWGWLAIAIVAVTTVVGVFSAALDDTDEKLEETKKQLERTASQIKPFSEVIKNCVPKTVDFDKGFFGSVISGIDEEIDQLEKSITEILTTRFEEQQQLRLEDLNNIKEYQKQLRELTEKKLDIYRNQMHAEKTRFNLLGDNAAIEDALQYLKNQQEHAKTIEDAAMEAYRNNITMIDGVYENMDTSNVVTAATANFLHMTELKEAERLYNEEIAKSNALVDKAYDAYNSTALNSIRPFQNKLYNMGENIRNNKYDVDSFANDMKSITHQEIQQMNNVLSVAAQFKKEGRELPTSLKGAVEDILNIFSGLDEDMQEIAKPIMEGVIKGLEDEVPGLTDTASSTCQALVDAFCTALDINSPSRVMWEIGTYTMQGLQNGILIQSVFLAAKLVMFTLDIIRIFRNINLYPIGQNIAAGLQKGIMSQKETLLTTIRSVARELNESFKIELDIHSPSKVMRYNGQMIGEGTILGIKDKTPRLEKSFNEFKTAINADDMPVIQIIDTNYKSFDNIETDMVMGYTPENSSTVNSSNTTNTENNNISPNINIIINGGDKETATQTKYALEEIFEELFAGYARRKPRITEV